jgi:hypothetical protein
MKKEKWMKAIQEIKDGQLEGGFVILKANTLIVGGLTDPANNCDGGKCTNNCNGGNCGNCVEGCGVKQ